MAQAGVMERTATYTTLAPEARCLYDIYKKEGDVFYCRRKYKKALLSYNEALRLANHSAQTLVARSRCYMGIGMMGKALEDTEAALSISGAYLPAVYQKAQILYRQGNYEMALMMFNRGHKLNPSAPGFLEGVQKAQHAMDILATGRTMKTTVVGDLSFCLPKKNTSFHGGRRALPGLGKSLDSSNIGGRNNNDLRLPSPGFSKRHSMMLLNAHKRQPPVLSEASYGREGKHLGHLDDKAMRDILGQLYDDKQYFERILNSGTDLDPELELADMAEDQGYFDDPVDLLNSPNPPDIQISWFLIRKRTEIEQKVRKRGHKSDDLSGMLNSVLEDGLKFLYDRVLFWAQNGSLPPVAPPPAVVAKHYLHLKRNQHKDKVPGLDAETNSGEQSDGEESEDELIKVNQAIDAVSSVNDPEAVANRKKKKLLIRKRRADILRKRSSMVVVTKRKAKKSLPRDSKESLEPEPELMTPSRIEFHFSSLLPATGREERPNKQQRQAHVRRSLPEGSKLSWEDDSATESGMVAVDDREEERQRRRAARKLRKQQQREADKRKDEEEKYKAEKEFKDEEPREDPLADYLEKVMNTMEELYQKADLKALKVKAESFLLTMERYDPSIVGTKMAYVGRAHSYLGNAHLGFRHYDFALMHHEKDLEIGQRCLAQKSKMVTEAKETAWLYHEIASCFLQLHHYRFAHDAASKALAAAGEAGDSLYLMQASVLQGAIQVKLQQYDKAYGSFEQAMENAKLRDDKRAQQAITEALKEVNEKMAQQARDLQGQEMSVIAAAEGGLRERQVQQDGQGQEAEEEEKRVTQAVETKNGPLETAVRPQEKKEENVDQGSERAQVENEGTSDKKFKSVSAGSAANTGEDPELLALVSDEEDSTHTATAAVVDQKEKNDAKQEKNEEDDKKKQDGEKMCNENSKGNERKKQAPEPSDEENKQNHTEKTEVSSSKGQDQVVTKDEITGKEEAKQIREKNHATAVNEPKKQDQKEAAVETEEKDREAEDRKKGEIEIGNDNNDKAGEEKEPVVVVVTGEDVPTQKPSQRPSNEAVTESKESGAGAENTDKQDGINAKDELVPNVGPNATYKGRPITAESLAKSMAKDKGVKHAPDQSVVTLNNTISREASRLYSADTSDNKADKKVVIAEGPVGEFDKNTAQEKVKEKRPQSPVEPRGKDPVTDKLEDDLKLMAQEFNDKEFDKVIKRGGEIMKALKKVKNIDAWSKRRLRIFSKVHSYLGSASSEKQNFDKARQHHNADLKIGEAMKDTDIQSRALEHLGRTFIFENKYEKALEYFAKRAHLPRDTEDTARLFHEIANCFFLLKAYEFAKDAAMVSLKAANEGGHTLFQLQSTVLIAVMKVKLNRVDTAFETFEEAMKFAFIRDDKEAAEAIRGAMRQIEDRVAAKVRDKWLAKIGKKPGNVPPEAETAERNTANEKETGERAQRGDQPVPSVYGIIKSMKEEDQSTNTNHNEDPQTQGFPTSRGKRDGSETNRTQKNEFLDAPEGALDKKPSTADRVVKLELPEGESGLNTATKRKVPKKKGTEVPAAKVYTIKKTNAKEAQTTKAKVKKTDKGQTTQKSDARDALERKVQNQEIEKETESNGDIDEEKDAQNNPPKEVAGKSEDGRVLQISEADAGNIVPVIEPKEVAISEDHQKNDGRDDSSNEADVAKDEPRQQFEAPRETEKENEQQPENSEKLAAGWDEPAKSEVSAQPPKPKKPKLMKSTPGFYDKTYEEDIAHRMKLRTAYVAPKPKQKSPPAVPTEEDEEKAKQAMMERRKSQRFIGLDPKKVAEAKSNPPAPIKEENLPPPKPKTERFVGLKIKPNVKSPRKGSKVEKITEQNENQVETIEVKVSSPEKRVKYDVTAAEEPATEQDKLPDRRESLMVPPLETITPLGIRYDPELNGGDVGYDANMPSSPIMALNEEMPMIRKDSVGSKHTSRPATRLSLAEMVREDAEVTPKGASKAELSALNDLVQDSIRQDRKWEKGSSPPKVVLKKPEPTFREKRLAEEKAAMERARRRRFLANQKASFILMLTSPYAEVPSLKNRRNSQWFPLLRRRTIAANMMAENYGTILDVGSDMKYQHASGQTQYDDGSGSPRKHIRQSEKDILPRKMAKKENPMAAAVYAEDATAAEKYKLALAAKEMRRKERDDRREERKKLQEEEKKRRQIEREESELLKLTPRTHYPNPYNKPPTNIPGLEQHYVPSPEDDDMELKWRREGERMLRREKLRAKREKEIQRLQKEDVRKRKFDKLNKQPYIVRNKPKNEKFVNGCDFQKTVVSPLDKTSPEKEESTPDSGHMDEVTPEMTPEFSPNDMSGPYTETTLSPGQDDELGEDPVDKDDAREEEQPPPLAQEDTAQRQEKTENSKKEVIDKKKMKSKAKQEDVPGNDNKNVDDEKDKKGEDGEEKPEEENIDEEFDGYNDDDEDKEDEVAIHIEREARQMKEDYTKGQIDAVIQRGTDLLKSLRKHIDIVSWSRRRLRWFGVAHSYMGSALADQGEHDKAKSHHQADFRIGEALGEHKMQSRALEHLARISIAENQIPKALEYLAKRAHLPRDSETSARIFLDMGNCFLQMGAIEFARDAAIQGLSAAKEGSHGTYQLQSCLLIAVCQAKLKDFDDAKTSFETALEEARGLRREGCGGDASESESALRFARIRLSRVRAAPPAPWPDDDVTTQAAIKEAIEQLEMKRATMVRDKWKGKKGGVEPTPITGAIPEDDEAEIAETAQA
ncbi:tetratricopeptide repeat protein 25 [Plakobranchus ocellatus]|uniref:Outer dynein arm-docking complex subunit 4 n=1 Tax=Plakobranchus ocellatus TaxID=259542 RepID=A0AAV4BKP3_9GAST|nr:tetratricopeptide repeat protein 25 [Plakobranchus ocellatus]